MLPSFFQGPILEPRELEKNYRQSHLKNDARQIQVIIALLAAIILGFGINDTWQISNEELRNQVRLLRVTMFGVSLLVIANLHKIHNAKVIDNVLLAWWLFIFSSVLFIDASRNSSYMGHLITDILLIIAVYSTTHFRFCYQLFAALFFTTGSLLLFAHVKALPPETSVFFCFASLVLANALGIIQALQIHRVRRQQYKAISGERHLRKIMEHLAHTDELTELNNRRNFFSLARVELRKCKRHGRPLSLAAMDVDYFKTINDTYGHHAGDIALKQLAQLLKEQCREEDIVARIGGEEFAILFPESSLEDARKSAERLREFCQNMKINSGEQEFSMTLSIGLTQTRETDANIDETLSRADDALYQAKRNGRNQLAMDELTQQQCKDIKSASVITAK